MKQVKVLLGLWGAALWMAACAIPTGDNLLITRDGNPDITYIIDYNLQTYVPIPSTGQQAVTMVNNRGDLDLSVVWKDQSGVELPGLTVFADNTVYQAEIRLTPKAGYRFDPSTSFEYHPGKVTAQNDNMGESTRTVTVTYNNSNDADITFITDYNLQSYVPIPMEGEKPVRADTSRGGVAVEAAWEVEQTPGVFVSIPTGDSYTFALGAVYRAAIRLTVKSGYRFSAVKNFEYPAGTVATQSGPNNASDDRNLSPVTYLATQAATVINDLNLTRYIPRPVTGAAAIVSFAGSQYTGTVVWKNRWTQAVLVGPFQPNTEYTAEVSLSPVIGYTFTGVGQNAFTHTKTENVSNAANSGAVRIDFLATASPGGPTVIYDLDLTSRIAPPAYGVTPVKSVTGSQYTGTVVWKKTVTQAPLLGSFQSDTEYTAVVTLIARSGYTFTGIGQNAFSHEKAGTVSNPAHSGTVTINFSPEAFLNYTVNSFGPVGEEDSALAVMMEKSNDDRAVIIELPSGDEDVLPNSVNLEGEINCPANVTIEGNGRKLKVSSPGTLLTVGENVTLTLRNLILIGNNANNTPLVKVLSRGRLILDGVTLQENQTIKKTGGVWVNGGALVMNQGSAIKKMTVTTAPSDTSDKAGGVFIDNNGRFTMYGGAIGGEADPADGNTVSVSSSSSGGVFVDDGGFDMYGGTIGYNVSSGYSSGGGVFVRGEGVFNQYGGTIKGNTAGEFGGGGVYNVGAFTMDGVAVIEGNSTVEFGGGGVSNAGVFIMRAGTIQDNTAPGPGPLVSGGGFGGGVSMSNGGTFIMYGGTIKRNRAIWNGSNSPRAGGVFNGGTFNMYGGTIGGGTGDANIATGNGAGIRANGALVHFSRFIMSGGTITGNTDVLADNDYGIYVHAQRHSTPVYDDDDTFTMSGSARITPENKVFLNSDASTSSNKMITIGGDLSDLPAGPAANIIMSNAPSTGTRLLRAESEAFIARNYNRFLYDNNLSGHIENVSANDGAAWYGTYHAGP